MKRKVIIAILLMFPFVFTSCQSKQIILNKNMNVEILIPDRASETEQFAAEELQRYIKLMTGKHISIVKHLSNDVKMIFSVGKTRFTEKYKDKFAKSPASAEYDGFVTDITDNLIILYGGSDRGTLYSVYNFLENQGCRWFFPGKLGEVIPKKSNLELNPGIEVQIPDFVQRQLGIGMTPGIDVEDMIDWIAKNRLNRNFALRYYFIRKYLPKNKWDAASKRGGNQEWQWICHNLSFMLPVDKYFSKHPEYYALYKGKRIPSGSKSKPGYGGGNLCTTNPEVIKICANFAIDWFDKHPEGVVVPVWPGDGGIKWCECKNCKKLGGINFFPGKRGSMSRRMVTFANAVAKIVAKRYPDRFILCPAYSNYVQPVDIPLEKNVLIQYCVHGCYAHGIDICKPNKKEMDMLLSWTASAKGRMGVWEYFLLGNHHSKNVENPAMLPVIYRSRDTLKFYKNNGVNWYFTQTSPKYWKHNIFAFYETARLIWDADQDFDALFNDFFDKFYGNASDPLKEFYRLIENKVYKESWHPQTYADVAVPSTKVFTHEILKQCEQYIKSAEIVKLSAIEKKRVALVRKTFNHIKANAGTQGMLGIDPKSPWRMERGEDFYIINADGKNISEDDMKAIVWYAKDTGSYNKDFQRLIFRAQKRKVPIKFIENENIKVGVIPELGGRIIRFIDKKSGLNFMKEKFGSDTLKSIGSAYFNYGGYEEYAGKAFASPGWETAYKSNFKEDEIRKYIVLSTDLDDLKLTRTISIKKDGSPELFIESVLTNKRHEPVKIKLRAHPMMTLGSKCGDYSIIKKMKNGEIKKSTLSAEHDSMSPDTEGVWIVIDDKKNIGIANIFDPKSAIPYLCKTGDDYFNLELLGTEKVLKPGESLKLSHSYKVLGNAKKEVKTLLKQ